MGFFKKIRSVSLIIGIGFLVLGLILMMAYPNIENLSSDSEPTAEETNQQSFAGYLTEQISLAVTTSNQRSRNISTGETIGLAPENLGDAIKLRKALLLKELESNPNAVLENEFSPEVKTAIPTEYQEDIEQDFEGAGMVQSVVRETFSEEIPSKEILYMNSGDDSLIIANQDALVDLPKPQINVNGVRLGNSLSVKGASIQSAQRSVEITPSESVGTFKGLVFKVRFAEGNKPQDLMDSAVLQQELDLVSDYFREISSGLYNLELEVYPTPIILDGKFSVFNKKYLENRRDTFGSKFELLAEVLSKTSSPCEILETLSQYKKIAFITEGDNYGGLGGKFEGSASIGHLVGAVKVKCDNQVIKEKSLSVGIFISLGGKEYLAKMAQDEQSRGFYIFFDVLGD
jgi:hypothetical protein